VKQPTHEQLAIVDFIRSRKENLQIDAKAGTGKTTTLVDIAEAYPLPTIAIAFNKKNAEDLGKRMPSHVESKTQHSVGFAATKKYLTTKCTVNFNKKHQIIKEYIEGLGAVDKSEAYNSFSDIRKAIDFGYSSGWIPETGRFPVRGLIEDHEFEASLEFEPSNLERKIIRVCMTKCIEEGLKGNIDFDDMVYLPALWPMTLPQYPHTMVDEAQDISPLGHRLIDKMVGKNRLTAVGDPCQAIYAFRGADETSMSTMRERFDMSTLPLNIAFRCPREVIRNVHWRAPEMTWPEWAIDGEVRTMGKWDSSLVPDGAYLICRNNAPIFRMAMRFIRDGRKPKVLGNDITAGIVKSLRNISKDDRLPSEQALELFETEARKLRVKYKNSGSINDKIECIENFLIDQPTLGLAILRAKSIMDLDGNVQMMTGHRSKGGEAKEVFFLDQHLVKDEGQDRNLRYVICTRAQERLTYITTEEME
jgi:hypothetical protein